MIAAIVMAPPLVIWTGGVALSSVMVCVIITLQLMSLLSLQLTRPRKT